MMRYRKRVPAARGGTLWVVAGVALLAGCIESGPFFGPALTSVRMVNAASPPVGLLNGAQFVSQNVSFQGSSGCATVPSDENDLAYVVRGMTLPEMSGLFGSQVTVFATTAPDGPGFSFQSLQVALRSGATNPAVTIVNGTISSRFDVHIVGSSDALGTPTAADVGSGPRDLTEVSAGTWVVRVTNVGSTTVRASLPERAFTTGQHTAIVIAPPDTIAGSPIRAFYWTMSPC
jgi:hypothetical protein